MSRGVEATSGDPRATSRLRISQLNPLIDMTRDAEAAREAAGVALPETAPLTTTEADPEPEPRPRRFALPVTVSLALLVGGAILGYARLHPQRAAPIEDIDAAPTRVATVAASATEPRPPQPGATTAEIQARASLELLRTGLDGCIRNGIHALPGSSPAVPPGLDALKDSAYTPAPADWKTAVWSCAHFQISDPMQFQVQWQLAKPNAEGMGIAWIDQDHDGVADRALGFSVKIGRKGAPIIGDIAPIAATTPVSNVRR
jgi:hypothetical protein